MVLSEERTTKKNNDFNVNVFCNKCQKCQLKNCVCFEDAWYTVTFAVVLYTYNERCDYVSIENINTQTSSTIM